MTTNDQRIEATPTVGDAEPSTDSAEHQVRHTDSAGDDVEGEPGNAPPAETDVESPSEKTLFADDVLTMLRARWDQVQAVFVDDPRACVQKADGLVADVVQHLVTGFADARSGLEQQWGRGEEASTEDLRVALMRYREFFDRLLKV